MNRVRLVHLAAMAFLVTGDGRAGWLDDVGYPQLSAELGVSLPTGAGISVLQTEAGAGMPQASATSPFAGTGNYLGKTFTKESGGMVYSGHADSVAANFYGNSGSASRGVTEVHLMDASGFINSCGAVTGPPVSAGIIHNHSWIGTTTGDVPSDNYYLRAFDYQINRDGIVSITPLNNGTGAVPTFMANSYHSISVGVRSGNHSRGGSTADGAGRMKPDLVVNEAFTSFAGPAVASVAAMLRQAIKADYAPADNPQTIKAILLAGASKNNLPGWHRATTAKPYDSTYGAGELNVVNAHRILVGGPQAANEAAEVSATGWDCNTAQSTGARLYYFSVPAGTCGNLFSAALTWHRSVTYTYDPGLPPTVQPSASYAAALPNLSLKLRAAIGLVAGATLDQSLSPVDNVEHLFLRNLPAGQYALEVSSDADDIGYGLAWQTQSGTGPATVLRVDAGVVSLDLIDLDPFVTYTIQKSSNLSGWSNSATVRTADSTPATTYTWQDPAPQPPGAMFYRLQWTAIR